MRILLVEDDALISAPVVEDLRRQNHVVDVTGDGATGLAFAQRGIYDAILLDVMLPEVSGIEICRRIRREGCDAMILMVTAKDKTDDKVAGLDAGADDYVVKPFDLAELGARLRAIGRRHAPLRETTLRYGPVTLDPAELRVRVDEQTVALTPSEFALLEAMMRQPMRVFSRSMLLEKTASLERAASDESIKTHVANLRRKLRRAGCPYDPIETLYGNGYRLAEPP